jgi:uncharacterized membrane protein YecN with MAPEG domain
MTPSVQCHAPWSTFQQEQRNVRMGIATAAVVSVFVLSIAYIADQSATELSFAARLEHAVRLDLFVVIWLVAAIANVARLRFFSEQDIGGASSEHESAECREARAILQNTLEQVVLAVITYAIVAASFPRSTWLLGALVGLFAIGRLLFWIGYRRGAKGRALGFGLTFYPNIIALLASAAAIITN